MEGHFYDKTTKEACCGLGDCYPYQEGMVKELEDGLHLPDTPQVFPYERVIWKSKDGRYWRCAPWVGASHDYKSGTWNYSQAHRSEVTRCILGPPRGF